MPSKWLSEDGAGVLDSVKIQINPIAACGCKPMLTWRATGDLYARKKAKAGKDLRYSTTALYSASSIRAQAQIFAVPAMRIAASSGAEFHPHSGILLGETDTHTGVCDGAFEMTADPESTAAMAIASVLLASDQVSLTWSDGLQQSIHAACLRYSPGFPGGERPAGAQGRFPAGPPELAPRQATLGAGGELQIEWHPGGIRSTHAAEWLRERRKRSQLVGQQAPGQVTWDARTIRDLPQPAYDSLQRDEAARLELFEQVLNWGVTRIRDVPPQPGIVETVASWFGQVQANPYADDLTRPVIASIRVDPATPVATRQSHFLGPHTDTCWRQTLIGLLLMHCLKAHPQGGRSMLVDGFTVASRLRAESPEAFELLSTVPIGFGAVVGEQDDWRAQGRVISVSADGVVEGIRYNGNSIDQLDLPGELIEPMYTALQRFESILYDRDLWWRPLLAPGDLLVIDNHRVLHGREAFDAASGERHLQCCNVERDDFHNRYRRLARLRGQPDWARRLSAGVF